MTTKPAIICRKNLFCMQNRPKYPPPTFALKAKDQPNGAHAPLRMEASDNKRASVKRVHRSDAVVVWFGVYMWWCACKGRNGVSEGRLDASNDQASRPSHRQTRLPRSICRSRLVQWYYKYALSSPLLYCLSTCHRV